jgi:hypothetical protein
MTPEQMENMRQSLTAFMHDFIDKNEIDQDSVNIKIYAAKNAYTIVIEGDTK